MLQKLKYSKKEAREAAKVYACASTTNSASAHGQTENNINPSKSNYFKRMPEKPRKSLHVGQTKQNTNASKPKYCKKEVRKAAKVYACRADGTEHQRFKTHQIPQEGSHKSRERLLVCILGKRRSDMKHSMRQKTLETASDVTQVTIASSAKRTSIVRDLCAPQAG